jgi:hypothetical protein
LDFVEIVYRSGWLVKGYILSSFSQYHRPVKFRRNFQDKSLGNPPDFTRLEIFSDFSRHPGREADSIPSTTLSTAQDFAVQAGPSRAGKARRFFLFSLEEVKS